MSSDDPARPCARTLRRIAAHGWAIEYVLSGPGHAGLAYTIGLSDLDRPEVYVRDLSVERAGRLLEEAAQAVMVNTIQQGGHFRSSGGLCRVGTDVDAAPLVGAIALYGAQVKAPELVRLSRPCDSLLSRSQTVADDLGQAFGDDGGGVNVLGLHHHAHQ